MPIQAYTFSHTKPRNQRTYHRHRKNVSRLQKREGLQQPRLMNHNKCLNIQKSDEAIEIFHSYSKQPTDGLIDTMIGNENQS